MLRHPTAKVEPCLTIRRSSIVPFGHTPTCRLAHTPVRTAGPPAPSLAPHPFQCRTASPGVSMRGRHTRGNSACTTRRPESCWAPRLGRFHSSEPRSHTSPRDLLDTLTRTTERPCNSRRAASEQHLSREPRCLQNCSLQNRSSGGANSGRRSSWCASVQIVRVRRRANVCDLGLAYETGQRGAQQAPGHRCTRRVAATRPRMLTPGDAVRHWRRVAQGASRACRACFRRAWACAEGTIGSGGEVAGGRGTLWGSCDAAGATHAGRHARARQAEALRQVEEARPRSRAHDPAWAGARPPTTTATTGAVVADIRCIGRRARWCGADDITKPVDSCRPRIRSIIRLTKTPGIG